MEHRVLSRRDALRKLAAGGVGAATSMFWVDKLSALAHVQAAHVHASAAAAQPGAKWAAKVFTAHQLETVATLSELIIPQTDTPGARATHVDRFIDSVLEKAARAERDRFLKGLAWLDARSTALFRRNFVSSSPEQQTELLTKLSAADAPSPEDRPGVELFQAIKSMTITGYYTTEIGLHQELGDDGRLFLPAFEGCNHPEHQG